MSRSSRPHQRSVSKGPQLPFALQQQLGLPQGKKRGPRTQIADHRQRRQSSRRGGRGEIRGRGHDRPVQRQQVEAASGDDKDDEHILNQADEETGIEDIDLDEDDDEAPSEDHSRQSEILPTKISNRASLPTLQLRPPSGSEDESDRLSRGSREYSPEVVLDAGSRFFQDRQAEDDAEILALEKKLGLKSKKAAVLDDNFDDLLGSPNQVVDSRKRKREDKEWLDKKRQKSRFAEEQAESQEEDVEQDCAGSEDELDSEEDDNHEVAITKDGFEGFDEDEEEALEITAAQNRIPVKPARENPYIAPTVKNRTTKKYVPPSRREPPVTHSEKLQKLRKQAQGHLNKLSEANIISIVDEFDKLYQTSPRQEVTTVIIDLLLLAFTNKAALQNTFIILHAAFVAALYKLLGADFAAEMVSKFIETFDKHHNDQTSHGKESLNLTSFLANLFTFGVVSSILVYDQIRLLLSDFGESSAELLLRIIRDCGPQLRSDDPTALKDIVQTMNEISARMTSNGQTINVRTQVMMDEITNLKNNKTRQATNAVGVTGEHITRMRKALGSLSIRQLRGTEPLGITRSDLLNSDKKGKWWLVGASWKGHGDKHAKLVDETAAQNSDNPRDSRYPSKSQEDFDDEIDYVSLTSHFSLNNPVRRSIFVAITSATDARDALLRLSKLRLTRKQELEIARVLLRTCRAELVYNPYYAVLSRLLLKEGKKYKMSFQVVLWKFFEVIGEKTDADEGSDDDGATDGRGEGVTAAEIANVSRMYAYLISKGALHLDVLKTLNIGFTKEDGTLFLELLFITLFAQSRLSDEELVGVLSGVEPRLCKSLVYFLQKNVRRSDLVATKDEKRKVKHGCQMAEAAFAALEGQGMDIDGDMYD